MWEGVAVPRPGILELAATEYSDYLRKQQDNGNLSAAARVALTELIPDILTLSVG